MKFLKNVPLLLLFIMISCHKDDDKEKPDPPRDEREVYQENKQQIKDYLETHFYYLEAVAGNSNFKKVVFDTIAGDHAGETPLMDSDNLKSLTLKPNNVEYTVYYLQIRKGAEEEYQPTFADKVAMTYQISTLDGNLFREAVNPEVIDIPQAKTIGITKGTIAAITNFKGASGFDENPDGTITYHDDYGIGAVFVPSGLGYFQSPPLYAGLKPYHPFIFAFQLYKAVQMDHDGDGIPSYMEDLNGNGFLDDDDTDNDGTPNYLDDDDDGDGIPTSDEIEVNDANGDGIITEDEISFPDTNNSGTPDYLDPDN